MKIEIDNIREYKTPAIPHVGIEKPEEDEATVNEEKQDIYKYCVGTLLYLIKHSRPDLSNCVRELCKVNKSATKGNYKQMLRAVKYIEKTANKGVIFKTQEDKG